MVSSITANPFPQIQPRPALGGPQTAGQNTGESGRPTGSLEVQIAQQVAQAGAGANVNVQYQYATGADGRLVAVSATVSVTEETALPERFGGNTGVQAPTGNLVLDTRDIIDIRGRNNGDDNFSLSAAERDQVRQLQASDAAVRVHEGLHLRAAGGLGSAPQFQTVTGPDGRQYAVAGSVGVSTSATTDPEKAARDAQTLVIAATAPADASAQDFTAARQFSATANTNPAQPEPTQRNPFGEPVDLIV